MTITIAFAGGCLLGMLIVWLIFMSILVGDLRVDRSDEFDGPYLFLELHKDMNHVTKNNYVLLKVKEEDFVPRK